MNTIRPDDAQARAFASRDQTQPIVMINLLKFHETARYADDGGGGRNDGGCSGLEAYMRYAEVATKKLAGLGGRVLWSGPAEHTFIGPPDVQWDMVAVVYYPSRATFLEMLAEEDYQAAHVHREAGVAHMHLIQCDGSGVRE